MYLIFSSSSKHLKKKIFLIWISQVDGLKEVLAVQEVVLAEKNAAADALITVVGAESEKVAKEKAIGNLFFYFMSFNSIKSELLMQLHLFFMLYIWINTLQYSLREKVNIERQRLT